MTLPPFQTLLNQHARDVHRFLNATVGAVDADDCYQETWLAALRAYPELRSGSNLRGWLLTIAHRKAVDCLRRRGRDGLTDVLPDTPVHDDYRLPDGGPLAAVRALPRKQREAVALRYVLDAEYPLIASMMGISEDAARRNVHEGLKTLRKEYTDDGAA